jgi:hypothetical protein
MSEKIPIQFFAGLKGGHPVDDEDEGYWDEWPEDWREAVLSAAREGDMEEASRLCRDHISATFYPHDDFDHSMFEGAPEEIPADDVVVEGGVGLSEDFPVFRWWSAVFTIEVPFDVLMEWVTRDEAGDVHWSEDAFADWSFDNEVWFQDGVRWALRGVPYDLDGMGEHRCTPDPEDVVDKVEAHLNNRANND